MTKFLWFFIAAICVAAAIYIVVFPVMAVFQLLNSGYQSQLSNLTQFLNFDGALLIILLFPFVEEVIFRGALFLYPARRWSLSPVVLILVSSSLFMLTHTVIQMPAAFVAGVILALVAWWSQSLWLPILIHVIHNFTTWILMRFFDQASFEMLTTPFAWQPWLISIAVFAVTAYFSLRYIEQTKRASAQLSASFNRVFSLK